MVLSCYIIRQKKYILIWREALARLHPYLFLVVARLRVSVKGGGSRAWLRAIEGVFGWAFQSAFTFAKANQRAQMLQLLLPKASFWSTTNQKHLYPRFHLLLGKKNYPALPLPKNGSFFFSNRVAPRPPHFAVTKQTTPPPALLLPVAVATAPPRRRRLSSSPRRRRRCFSSQATRACKVVVVRSSLAGMGGARGGSPLRAEAVVIGSSSPAFH